MHRIPLATFNWQRTEPQLEVHSHTINLVYPSRFGDLPWMLQRSEVAVVDTRDQIAVLDDGLMGRTDVDYTHLNVPYIATSTASAPPTTGLLFTHPKEHPSLGLLDGFLVREENPGQLIELAAGLGQETATGLHWFADHRRIVPPQHSPVRSTIRRVESAGVATAAAGGGLFFLAAGQNMHHRTGRAGLLLLLGGTGVAVVTDWIGRHRSSNGDLPRSAGANQAVGAGHGFSGNSERVGS